ncbi:hypothetical protein [Penaeicola halotolerans]|uniref:hypothetical protein n=1 Tax=Penaeicola halotolerans TaxID=2793196 RepID=UPI001CF91A97|nr:hypothetical protein [Penaeicola halotolerans]
MPLSLDNIRVGKRYRIKNFGEITEVQVMARISDENYKVKDLVTLEVFELEDLIRYGLGKDYDIDEI